MKIRYWGTRGSIPTPGKDTIVYGGNTACLSVEIGESILIFDAGTGIRVCGNDLMSRGKKITTSLFISHTHWDHIQGFPFFIPAYVPGNRLTLYGPPSDIQDQGLKQIMEFQTKYEFFPISLAQLGADIQYVNCKEGKIDTGEFEMYTCRINHPIACLAYKLVHDGKVFIYGGDHEPYRNIYRDGSGGEGMDEDFLEELDRNAEEQNAKIIDFCKNADLVSWDGQYTEEEYQSKIGWGHSSHEADIELARKASIKHMIITHHEPMNSDEKLAVIEEKVRARTAGGSCRFDFAKEGMVVEL
ncbi:MAG: MBL fold metallo-hydrolase [Chitinispirillaceae bacterium]|nr:MBL fold metallo-hydrolase [Chitinispirillaceae bacterium]